MIGGGLGGGGGWLKAAYIKKFRVTLRFIKK